jgi:hypothetical protein
LKISQWKNDGEKNHDYLKRCKKADKIPCLLITKNKINPQQARGQRKLPQTVKGLYRKLTAPIILKIRNEAKMSTFFTLLNSVLEVQTIATRQFKNP